MKQPPNIKRTAQQTEPADSLRDDSNVIGGWLPTLTIHVRRLHMPLISTSSAMKPHKRKNLAHSAVKLAQKLLKKDEDGLEELRMHDFPDDESAHDDEFAEQLYAEFSADVEEVQAELSKEYGPPSRKGQSDTRIIPLNGVFRYAIWQVADKYLFVAAHHEDRGIPIVLWLGTVPK